MELLNFDPLDQFIPLEKFSNQCAIEGSTRTTRSIILLDILSGAPHAMYVCGQAIFRQYVLTRYVLCKVFLGSIFFFLFLYYLSNG